MKSTPKIITIDEVRIILGLPNHLIRDLTSWEFNGEKLMCHDDTKSLFEEAAVFAYKKHLSSKWPQDKRDPPDFIKRYAIWEASNRCALCRVARKRFDFGHVKDWTKTYSHHPHNILYLCVECHAEYTKSNSDYPTKLLQLTKEELLREKGLISIDPLFDCDEEMEVGDAVHIREEHALRAVAMDSAQNLATCFVSTIVGSRCTVVRCGSAVGIRGLTPSDYHYLSPARPGKVDTLANVLAEYNALLDTGRQPYWQRVGRAETTSRLAIQFQQGIGLPQAV